MGPDKTVTLEEYFGVLDGCTELKLTESDADLNHLRRSFEIIDDKLADGEPVYGVNTGFGESCRESVPPSEIENLPENLIRFHGCGTGDPFSPSVSLGIAAIRLITLSQGASGVRLKLLRTLSRMVNEGVVPVIPEEGSVGASGDLTPLSYLAAVLMGERSVWDQGKQRPADEVLEDYGIEPLDLRPKESLALMNGTTAMSALTAQCFRRAKYLLKLASTLAGMAVTVLDGNPSHFDKRIYDLKDHTGQGKVATLIRRTLDAEDTSTTPLDREDFVQDRYSLRCVPQVLGVLADYLPEMKESLETEINGVDDNPLVDVETGDVLHGGNFYGGHVAFVADALKNTLANMADLMDRQLAQLVDPKLNRGLPSNLSGAPEEKKAINHGFKALQIASSSWAAEAQKKADPGSVYSRTTESHNQDKVSMGSLSSRDARRVCELTEKTVTANLLALTQGIDLRIEQGELSPASLPDPIRNLHEKVRSEIEVVERDRPLEADIETVLGWIRDRDLPVADSVNFV